MKCEADLSWYRFVTLARLSHAILVVLRDKAKAQEKKRAATRGLSG
jgi:hypothetical protein